jgi:hypothetical protein
MPSNSRNNKKFHIALVKQMLTLATSGFGFVSALAWNSLIQEFVNNYVKKFLPNGSGILSLLIYALVVTTFAVIVTYQLSKLSNSLQD